MKFDIDSDLQLNDEKKLEYQNAIKKKFTRKIELSSGNLATGILTFDAQSNQQSKQVIPLLTLYSKEPVVSQKTGKKMREGGMTMENHSFVNVTGFDGKLQNSEALGS